MPLTLLEEVWPLQVPHRPQTAQGSPAPPALPPPFLAVGIVLYTQ